MVKLCRTNRRGLVFLRHSVVVAVVYCTICRQLSDNVWRGLRELHIWAAAWSSSLMSGRLDAFFSLTLCHSAVACVLFAGALSFYAPLATSYYQLVSLTAFLYWLVVLFILTLLTTTIQLVMRMVRVGSGQLLQPALPACRCAVSQPTVCQSRLETPANITELGL